MNMNRIVSFFNSLICQEIFKCIKQHKNEEFAASVTNLVSGVFKQPIGAFRLMENTYY